MNSVDFAAFREQWLEDIHVRNPSTIQVGQRFARKLFTQWRDVTDASDDLVYCDGPSDGGIDLAFLERGEQDGENLSGDTWYVVQSKYGTSFQGRSTLLIDGQKVIDTLDSNKTPAANVSASVVARIRQFLLKADAEPSGDRLILVFATEMPLNETERRALEDVRAVGRARFGKVFDVEAVSIETIYINQAEDPLNAISPPIQVPVEATMANSGKDLMVGSIALLNLYEFLKAYRAQTENLDQLYEKNVRRFLGGRGKVNKGMQATLNDNPAQFGLYNNGITIVVKDFSAVGRSTYMLTDPYIVNGCQTTRTLWEVFRQKLETGGSKVDIKLEEWKVRAHEGVVIAKIVRVGTSGEDLLQNITRYTNSQNAVKDKDFITLDDGFHHWKNEMASRYEIFLEVQRGGWDSQRAWQKQNPQTRQFTEAANAFDLLKVYGAGWLREAGKAFGSNRSFVPGGAVYRQIVERTEQPFGVDDLYAAYVVQRAGDHHEFGRGSRKASRKQTRYLFYLIALELLRDVLVRANRPSSYGDLTQAVLKLSRNDNEAAIQSLFEAGVGVVDEYLTQGEQDSVFNEPTFKNDLGGFLKSEQLGKAEHTPNLQALLAINKRTMGRGNPSPRDLITTVIA
ncbi:MAG: AIPR family protein [Nitrospiraceae bacterium]|nr:AIPR family protein [Nitrospiraceae bacterium]